MTKRLLFFALVFLIALSAAPVSRVEAETVNPAAVLDYRAKLEKELSDIETQIDAYKNIVQGKQRAGITLERDILILDAQRNKILLEIKAYDLRIARLADDITQHVGDIKNLEKKSEKERESLGELLRKSDELDNLSLIEIALTRNKLSEFFSEMDSFGWMQQELQNSLAQVRETKMTTEQEKDDLEGQKAEQLQMKQLQELEKTRLAEKKNEKNKILKVTKGEEAKYQKFLSDKQKDAANIRSQLFLLNGSPSIPFEKAVEYANLAQKATGVRPAFILGIIAEESNLGSNVGKGNWNEDLSNSRCAKQRTAFASLMAELGLDPNLMPLSKKTWYGYCGGAMGPAQFMPTTWQLYKTAIAKNTGHNPPDPWNPKDAFMAAALLLKDNGATKGNAASERTAALKYLAGGNWSKKAYAFYGDDVMEFAQKYQEQIDIISRQ